MLDFRERLDAGHEAIANPVGWHRGAEYWVPPATWHDIFENDEDAAVFGAQTLRDNGLLRIQSGQVSLQCCVKIRKEVKHCYCVSEKILAWAPSTSGSASPLLFTLILLCFFGFLPNR